MKQTCLLDRIKCNYCGKTAIYKTNVDYVFVCDDSDCLFDHAETAFDPVEYETEGEEE